MGKEPLSSAPLLFFLFSLAASTAHAAEPIKVDVGLVLDAGNNVGRTCRATVEMGLNNFYAKFPNYTTRAVVHFRDSGNSSIGAASAALDLLETVSVKAILGPLRSIQASFVIALGNKSHVPIISFAVTSPSLSPNESPYFVRTSLNSSSQVHAIASFVKTFAWREVVVIYEDTEFGASILPYLNDALQDIDVSVAYRSVVSPVANDSQIIEELKKLMTLQTRVFIVHMLGPIGSSLFKKAKELQMISEGYVWISTNGMVDLWDTLDTETVHSMNGVVGLKPYIPDSPELRLFQVQWRASQARKNDVDEKPTIYCLWAYDSAQALAMAIENIQTKHSNFSVTLGVNSMTGLANLGISRGGPQLLQEIQQTHFTGITGPFRIIDGQLQISTFQIVNMVDKVGKRIGFWSQTYGFSKFLNATNNQYSTSQNDLGNITWPGGTNITPKGWEIPIKGKVLNISVPVKKGFLEFVNATAPTMTGYCIDVFKAVIKSLPYQVDYKFEPYHFAQDPGSYDVLVSEIFSKKFDAAVGDVTIRSNRSQYVDFTLPYTESGVAMLVPIKENTSKNAWIFLKPLTWKLWLVIVSAFLFTGFVVWVIEHQKNDEFRGKPLHEAGTIFYFAFKTLFFAHTEQVLSNLSRAVIVVWVFVVLILTSSYTASLSSMLTFQQFQPAITNVDQLLRNKDSIGYQDGSFVRQILKDLKFDDSKISNYSNLDAYAEALDKGSANGGVSAIIDEIPYIKLFLKNRCSKYMMVPLKSYKAAGFGFVFPRGSPLLPDVSKAILKITQGEEIRKIEYKWFGDQTDCPTDGNAMDSNKLQLESFWGLFLITGVVSGLSVVVSIVMYLRQNWVELKDEWASEDTPQRKAIKVVKHYCNLDYKSLRSPTVGHGTLSTRTGGDALPFTPRADGSFTPFSMENPRTSSSSYLADAPNPIESNDEHRSQ